MATEITTAIAEAVRKRREVLGITQEQLAQRAHLNRTYISDIERGTRNFSVGIFDRLASALNISSSSLWKLAEEMQISIRGRETSSQPEFAATAAEMGD